MKLGITINKCLDKYIEEIANLNNISKTTLCGIIVENFLTFNKMKGRKPIITQVYQIRFEEQPTNNSSETQPKVEETPTMSREQIIERFENEQYTNTELNDDELPF